jgi:hypothetical protein
MCSHFDLTYPPSFEGFEDHWKHAAFMSEKLGEQMDLEKGFLFSNTHNFQAIDKMNRICRDSLTKYDFNGQHPRACEAPSRQRNFDFCIIIIIIIGRLSHFIEIKT